MTRALLFDMDGVLVDTEPVHEAARQKIYKKYAIPAEKIGDIPLRGRNTQAIFSDIHRRLPFPVPLAQAVAEKRSLFVSLLSGPIPLLPGVKALLDYYRRKMKLALVSASARSNVEAVLRATGVASYFEFLICEEEVEAFKPDPEGYLLAARRLALRPDDCVAFEDSAVGVAAAKGAGVRVVALSGAAPGENFSAADLVVENLDAGNLSVHQFIGEGRL